MATHEANIHPFPAQANADPPLDSQDASRKVTADIVESLIAKSLANDDLLGRLCASLVLAKIRRGGQR